MDFGFKPLVISEIRNIAKEYKVKRVMLFGSRARGDYHRASDIDLAVKGGDITGFALAVDEDTSTLLKFDIINLDDKLEEEFRSEITSEGVTIFEEI